MATKYELPYTGQKVEQLLEQIEPLAQSVATMESKVTDANSNATEAKKIAEEIKTSTATSETNAANSATKALQSETNATTSATEAKEAATKAETIEANIEVAYQEILEAENYASTAATRAESAAGTATTKATEAGNSATAAETARDEASASATAAAESEKKALQYANDTAQTYADVKRKHEDIRNFHNNVVDATRNMDYYMNSASSYASKAQTAQNAAAKSETNAAASATAAEQAKVDAEAARDEAVENNKIIDGKIEAQQKHIDSDEYKESIALKVPFVKTAEQPTFANSIAECTDTTKMYVLPDGYIYAYMTTRTPAGTEEVVERITDGFADNKRLSLSSGAETAMNGFVTTPYIDFSKYPRDAEIRLSGIDWAAEANNTNGYGYVVYDASNAKVLSAYSYLGEHQNTTVNAKIIASSLNAMVFKVCDESQEIKYKTVRFSGKGTAAAAVVQIVYTRETEGKEVTDWANTGHAFVPADYEDRIVANTQKISKLEEESANIKVRVKSLEDSQNFDSGIPDYVLAESEKVADKVLDTRNAYSFVMALASDFHTDSTDSSSVGVLHAGQATNTINTMTQLDLVALLGDYEVYDFSYGDTDTDGEDARKSFKHVKKAFYEVSKNVPMLHLQGNHDKVANATTAETYQKLYAYIGANNVGVITDYANKYRNYGYKDFADYKIRVIYLNTCDLVKDAAKGEWVMSEQQLTWLQNDALNLSDSEWGIIVLSHHPLNWYGFESLLDVLDNYKGTTVGAELIAHFHGHLHNFRAETLGKNNVLTVTIPNACFHRNNEYGLASAYDEEVHKNYGDTDEEGNQREFRKTHDSAEDTAFNVVVIDRQNRKIHCFNYGAGIDREIAMN